MNVFLAYLRVILICIHFIMLLLVSLPKKIYSCSFVQLSIVPFDEIAQKYMKVSGLNIRSLDLFEESTVTELQAVDVLNKKNEIAFKTTSKDFTPFDLGSINSRNYRLGENLIRENIFYMEWFKNYWAKKNNDLRIEVHTHVISPEKCDLKKHHL